MDSTGRRRALALVGPPRRWALWATRWLTGAGAALVLTGIVFFFAFNWARLAPVHKFVLIEAGLVASGLVLLAGHGYMRVRGFDTEGSR